MGTTSDRILAIYRRLGIPMDKQESEKLKQLETPLGELPAGRELDALVAEKVFSLIPCTDPIGRCEGAHTNPIQCWGAGEAGQELSDYSTDIAKAWKVVERLQSQRRFIEIVVRPSSTQVRVHTVASSGLGTFSPTERLGDRLADPKPPAEWIRRPTTAHAICLAALQPVGKDK